MRIICRVHFCRVSSLLKRKRSDCRVKNCLYINTKIFQISKLPTVMLQKNFIYLIYWCGNFVEAKSFHIVSGESSETLWKLFLSTKFPHQEIRGNYGIFRSVEFWRYRILFSSFCIVRLVKPWPWVQKNR